MCGLLRAARLAMGRQGAAAAGRLRRGAALQPSHSAARPMWPASFPPSRPPLCRYCAAFNRGRPPPSSFRLGPGEEGGGAAYGACCCLYRSLSLMEL